LAIHKRGTYLLYNELADQVVPRLDKSFVNKSPHILKKTSGMKSVFAGNLKKRATTNALAFDAWVAVALLLPLIAACWVR
jgi:hypothetical protein